MKLGVQSFTVFKDFQDDFQGTLKRIKDMGFRYVEWLAFVSENDYGMGVGLSPKEAVKIFDDNGMKLTGGILTCLGGLSGKYPKEFFFEYDEIQKVIDWYAEAGCTAIGIANDYFVDEEFFKKRMDAYNELGRRCAEAGMVWLYHNHFQEMQKIGDKTILELMVEMTDPNSVVFDWDLYWGVRGLVDPVEIIKTLGKKINRLHCKDFPFKKLDHLNVVKDLPKELVSWDNEDKYGPYPMCPPDEFTECGDGFIKWQDVINAANEIEIPYMFVEQDFTPCSDMYESLAVSTEYLLSLKGLSLL